MDETTRLGNAFCSELQHPYTRTFPRPLNPQIHHSISTSLPRLILTPVICDSPTTMRFSAPRSTSPSPERIQFERPSISRRKSPKASPSLGLAEPRTQQIRRTCTYGIHTDSESESDSDEPESENIPVDRTDADSDSEIGLTDALKYVSLSPSRYILSYLVMLWTW